MKEETVFRSLRLPALFRVFVTLVLCLGLMVPTTLTSSTAYAATDATYESIKDTLLPDYNHGTITVESENVQSGVIELSVGQSVDITVHPYQHVQYAGCRIWDNLCPIGCDETLEQHGIEGSCFIEGMGCICNDTASLETADVSATSSKENVATVSSVAPDTSITTSDAVGTTADGTVRITAVAPGESTVTVSADGLYFWYGATSTYTVKVGGDPSSSASISSDSITLAGPGEEAVYVQLSDVNDDWFAESVEKKVKVGEDVLDVSQYSFEKTSTGRYYLNFNRSDDEPVFDNEGDKVRSYDIAIEAASFETVSKTVKAFSYGAQTFTVRVLDAPATEGGTVKVSKTYTLDELNTMQNVTDGLFASTCSMTGARTFKASGVTLATLLENAGVSPSADDVMWFRVNDASKRAANNADILNDSADDAQYYTFGGSMTWGDISTPRYYFPAVYNDTAIKAMMGNANPTAEETLAFQQALAATADKQRVEPTIATSYLEQASWSADMTEQEIKDDPYSILLNKEKGFRFVYGIALNDAGDAVNTSENTTIHTTYAVYGIDVIQAEDPATPATVKANQQISLRAVDGNTDAKIALEGVDQDWVDSITSVKVIPLSGDVEESTDVLDSSQYSIDSATGTLIIHRSADDPVIQPQPGDTVEGVTVRKYANVKQYKIAIEASGYAQAMGTITAATGFVDEVTIQQTDAAGNVVEGKTRTYDASDLQSMAAYGFQNGSSQCGMAGVRTFSGNGISLANLIADVGITVEEGDAIYLLTSDGWSTKYTYDELFGTDRYFLQSVYDDAEAQAAYETLAASGSDEDLIAFRKVLAQKALEDNSVVRPMLSAGYTETILSGTDWVGNTPVPTAGNTNINSLVGLENQFRFIYGLKLVQEDCVVTFETGEGSSVEAQTVKSHLMTSTENTTMRSNYWVNGIRVVKDAGAGDAPSSAADAVSKPSDPTREGCAFAGWYTDEACTDGNEFDFEANDGTVDQSTTLYAKWVDEIDLGISFPEGASYVATSMGRNPAGETTFSLRPSDEALASYQAVYPDATKVQMLQAWIDGITSVSVGGTELSAKEIGEWKTELTDPVSDQGKLPYYWLSAGTSAATLKLPIALFDTTQSETDTKGVTIESSGFETVAGDVTYRNIGATAVTVRVLDKAAHEGGTVLYERALTMDQLKSLPTQSGIETSANCGMAGLRSYKSEGVYLTDVLNAAGVNFASGMTLKLRTTDMASTNDGAGGTEAAYISSGTFTYDSLMGVDRYHYPAMWDDVTTYEELGGKTIYEVVSANMRAWKGTDEEAKTLARLIGQSKVEVTSPVLAWAWNEGVVAWAGTGPADQGDYNQYTSHQTFRFLFGMQAADDGSIADDNTTFANTYGVFGIDVIAADYAPMTYDITYNLDGGTNAPANPETYAVGTGVQLAAPTKDGYTFGGWFTDAAFENQVTEIPADVTGAIILYAKWVSLTEDPTDPPGDQGSDDPNAPSNGSGVQQTGQPSEVKPLLKTGDDVSIVPILCFAGAAMVLLAIAMCIRRKHDLSDRIQGRE